MLPVTNAQLLTIAGGGPSEDYDTPAGADTIRWQGMTGIYVVDELVRSYGPGRVDDVRRTSFVAPARAARGIASGDTVTFRYQDVEHVRTVQDVRITEIAGTARIVLRDL